MNTDATTPVDRKATMTDQAKTTDFWVQSVSGEVIDLLSPDKNNIHLHDIATSLSRIPRYNGATIAPRGYSVAQHSLLVEALASASYPCNAFTKLFMLLHDAHEAYTGDLVTPVQRAMDVLLPGSREAYQTISGRLQVAIHDKFNIGAITGHYRIILKSVDALALTLERSALMAGTKGDWGVMAVPTDDQVTLAHWHMWPVMDAESAKAAFIRRALQLMAGER